MIGIDATAPTAAVASKLEKKRQGQRWEGEGSAR